MHVSPSATSALAIIVAASTVTSLPHTTSTIPITTNRSNIQTGRFFVSSTAARSYSERKRTTDNS